jgi:hypothetical protein
VAQGDGLVTPDATTHVLPCRPTISCTADIAAPGTLEVEVGYNYARSDPFVEDRNFPFLIKLTLSKLLQLQVESNSATFTSTATYFDDVFAGVKLHIADQGKLAPSFAVTALVGIPVHQYVGVLVTAHASKDIGTFHVDANVGINEVGVDTNAPASQAFAALALSIPLPAPFGSAIETYYYSDEPPLAPRDGGVRLVMTLTPRPWLVFDAGGDIGFFPSTRSFTVFFGMSIAPVVFWR